MYGRRRWVDMRRAIEALLVNQWCPPPKLASSRAVLHSLEWPSLERKRKKYINISCVSFRKHQSGILVDAARHRQFVTLQAVVRIVRHPRSGGQALAETAAILGSSSGVARLSSWGRSRGSGAPCCKFDLDATKLFTKLVKHEDTMLRMPRHTILAASYPASGMPRECCLVSATRWRSLPLKRCGVLNSRCHCYRV
jgi:hypothetical protein